MRRSNWAWVALWTVAAVSAAQAQDKVPNPAYQQWAPFKAGSWTKMQMTMQMGPGGSIPGMTTTRKLTELTPDQATVENSMSMTNGMTMPAHNEVIPAKIDAAKADAAMFSQRDSEAKVTDVKHGQDEITVGGKTLKCQTVEATVTSHGQTTHVKTWLCSDIPGGMVKMESQQQRGTMSMELVDFDVAK